MTGLRHSDAPRGKRRLDRTGAMMMGKMSAPSRANATVQAMGRKRRPSTACRVKMGRYAVMNDADGVEDGALHLVGGLADLLGRRDGALALVAEMTDDIFDHHDGTVDHHAKVESAEREQVGGNV